MRLKKGDLVKSVYQRDVLIIKIEKVNGTRWSGIVKSVLSADNSYWRPGVEIADYNHTGLSLIGIKIESYKIMKNNKEITCQIKKIM